MLRPLDAGRSICAAWVFWMWWHLPPRCVPGVRDVVALGPVEVVVVDHRRRPHDPGVGLAGVGIAALLGAKDRRLLLRLAHEDDPLAAVELGVVLLGDVVLALPLGEGDQGDLLLRD